MIVQTLIYFFIILIGNDNSSALNFDLNSLDDSQFQDSILNVIDLNVSEISLTENDIVLPIAIESVTNEEVYDSEPNVTEVSNRLDCNDNINNISTNQSSNIIVKTQSVDEVFNKLTLWSNKKTSQKKRKAMEHLPSVVTAQEWLEIMEAKDKDKKDKEIEKENKKIERQLRAENNKRLKEEKRIERSKKLSAKKVNKKSQE